METRARPTRWALTALTVLTVGLPAHRAAAVSGPELLERARASRQEAERELAEARQRHLAERKALAAELQQAYAELSAASDDAATARQAAEGLRAEVEGLEKTGALTARRTEVLIAQAAGAAGVKLDANADPEAMEQAVWRGLSGRLARLETDLHIAVEPREVVVRDGAQQRLSTLRLGGYASYACGPTRDTRGLLRALPDGREAVVGPHLDGPNAEALEAAATGQFTRVPIDVDGALADRAPAEPKGLRSWLAAGGLFVYPILVAGTLGLLLVADRVICLLRTRVPPAMIREVLARLVRGDPNGARQALGAPRTPLARVLWAAAEALGEPDEQREAAMESALLAEAPRLERSLSLLGALAGVAPLLGLLGTVSGMIATFETISAAGTGNPRLLSGGISEALITTQLGLMVAIPLLLAHAWLSRWVQRREAMLEYHAVQAFAGRRGAAGEGGEG